jgi:acyl-CoA synthetase (AMP-forming)/AMP-acid ligase II
LQFLTLTLVSFGVRWSFQVNLRWSSFLVIVRRFRITQDDTAALLYSSGTTGTSKGVAITHGNFISSLRMISALQRVPDQILLLVLPMFHVFGLVHCTLSTLFRGMTLVVLPRYDFANMLTAIQTYRATHLPLVPPIIISLAKQDLVFKFDLRSLSNIFCAAAPLGKETMDTCATRFPNVKLQQVCHSFHFFRIQYSFLIIPLFTNAPNVKLSTFLYVTMCNVGLNLCARILGICIDGIDMCWHHKPN